ncbi:hypothetical protein, partial [Archangium sp.]|uniref:hypothetical protein n=1 Tax=Archangium sp. TaxID=1872627 RepID=UPI0038D4ABD2
MSWWVPRAWVLVLVGLQMACATGYPLGGTLTGPAHGSRRVQREALARAAARAGAPSVEAADVDAEEREAGGARQVSAAEEGPGRPWSMDRRASEVDEAEVVAGKGIGWPDGVGDGRPLEVPMSLDYFQGFLVRAGVPGTALPKDGRTLGPQQALALEPHLLSTPITLGNFGLRRMAAHLLLEVATGEEVVTREELHARMRRFSR